MKTMNVTAFSGMRRIMSMGALCAALLASPAVAWASVPEIVQSLVPAGRRVCEWTSGDGSLSDSGKWSGGNVPQEGDVIFLSNTTGGDIKITCDKVVSPSAIVFSGDCTKKIQIKGVGGVRPNGVFTNVANIVNLSGIHHEVFVPVYARTGEDIGLTMANAGWVNFEGGVYARGIVPLDSAGAGAPAMKFSDMPLRGRFFLSGVRDWSRSSQLNGLVRVQGQATLQVPALTWSGNPAEQVNFDVAGSQGRRGDRVVVDGDLTMANSGSSVEPRFMAYRSGGCGEFVVKGVVRAQGKVKPYPAMNPGTGVFVAGGLVNKTGCQYFSLNGLDNGNASAHTDAKWVIGSGGLQCTGSSNAGYAYEVQSGSRVTLMPQADFTIAQSVGLRQDACLTLAPNDYYLQVPRTITVAGNIWSVGSAVVSGYGTVLFDANCGFSGGLVVTNLATLAVKSGKRPGSGGITMAKGTTLRLVDGAGYSYDGAFGVCVGNGEKVRIVMGDGKSLSVGTYKVFSASTLSAEAGDFTVGRDFESVYDVVFTKSGNELRVTVKKKSNPAPTFDIRCASYNMQGNGNCTDVAKYDPPYDPWLDRSFNQCRQLNKMRFDLAGLQETHDGGKVWMMGDAASGFESKHPGFGRYSISPRCSGTDPLLCDMGKFDVLTYESFVLSEKPWVKMFKPDGLSNYDARPCPWWGTWSVARCCTWSVLRHRDTGGYMVFANTHLDHRDAKNRREQMFILERRLRAFAEMGLPVVLTGDFNTHATSSNQDDQRVYATATSLFQNTGGTGVDYVFVTPGCTNRGRQSDSGKPMYASSINRWPSDHPAICAELTVPVVKNGFCLWTAGNGQIANAANWSGGAAPKAGDNLVFNPAASSTLDFTGVSAKFGRVLFPSPVGQRNTVANGALKAAEVSGDIEGLSVAASGSVAADVVKMTGILPVFWDVRGNVSIGEARFVGASSNKCLKGFAALPSSSVVFSVNKFVHDGTGGGEGGKDTISRFRLSATDAAGSDRSMSYRVGAGGFTFGNNRSVFACTRPCYCIDGGNAKATVTLKPTANYAVANSPFNDGISIILEGKSPTLVVETDDAANSSTHRTVTLNGGIGGSGTVKFTGSGTVKVNASCPVSGTLSLEDSVKVAVSGGTTLCGGNLAMSNGATLRIAQNLQSPVRVGGSVSGKVGIVVASPVATGTYPLLRADGIGTADVSVAIGSPTGVAIGLNDGIVALSDGLVCWLSVTGDTLYLMVNDPANQVYVGSESGNLSDPAGWVCGCVPVSGVAVMSNGVAMSVSVGNVFRPDTIAFAGNSGVVTITNGILHLASLKNADKLAIGCDAALEIEGDLVGYAANNTKSLLYSNKGTVTVGGKVQFRSSGASRGNSIVCQYAVTSDETKPIIASGLAYNADSWSDWLVADLGSKNNGLGKWVIGSGGLTIPRSRIIDRSGFRVIGRQAVTLYSAANWTLAESYRHKGNDLFICDSASVTVDTTDYNDHATPRTVTFRGYINAQGTGCETPLTVCGNGTLALTSVPANGCNNKLSKTLAVTDTATLKLNNGVAIIGSGTVSVGGGATLLAANSAGGSVTLPALKLTAGATLAVSNGGATPAINASSLAVVPGASGAKVVVRIGSGTVGAGTYTVLSASSISANAGDFVLTNMASGCSATFSTDGNALVVNVAAAAPKAMAARPAAMSAAQRRAHVLNLDPAKPDAAGEVAIKAIRVLGDKVEVEVALERRGAVQEDGVDAPINGVLRLYAVDIATGQQTLVDGAAVDDPTFADGDTATFTFERKVPAGFYRAAIEEE